MFAIKGVNVVLINNIPRNIGTGYGHWSSGTISYPDERFAFYHVQDLEGSSNAPLNTRNEDAKCFSVTFSELPCDADGNILMDSYEMTKITNSTWPSGPNFLQLTIFCKKKPTHRVNISTGEVIDNNSDNQYIKEITLSYAIINSTKTS